MRRSRYLILQDTVGPVGRTGLSRCITGNVVDRCKPFAFPFGCFRSGIVEPDGLDIGQIDGSIQLERQLVQHIPFFSFCPDFVPDIIGPVDEDR